MLSNMLRVSVLICPICLVTIQIYPDCLSAVALTVALVQRSGVTDREMHSVWNQSPL